MSSCSPARPDRGSPARLPTRPRRCGARLPSLARARRTRAPPRARSPRLPASPSMAARTSIEPPSSSRSASSSGGPKIGSAPDLLLAPDQASRNARRLERRRALGDVWPAYENTLAPEQPRPEFVLEPLPLSPRANRKTDEPLVVVSMPKDPSAPRRLPGPRSGRLEANELDAAPLQRVGGREPRDTSADDGDLCGRDAHEDRVYRLALESGPRGAVAELANAPVSKTGDSRFESWLPRLHRVIRVRPAGE